VGAVGAAGGMRVLPAVGAAGRRCRRQALREGGWDLALSRHGSGRVTAAPRSVAQQPLPRQRSAARGLRHVNLPPRHHAWRDTGFSPRHGNRRGQKC